MDSKQLGKLLAIVAVGRPVLVKLLRIVAASRPVVVAVGLLAVVAVGVLVLMAVLSPNNRTRPPVSPPEDGYVFCFWNVENLFDDQDDGRKQRGDKEFDEFFANDKPMLEQKLKNLTE